MANILENANTDNNSGDNVTKSNRATELTVANIPVNCRFAPYWLNSKYGNIGIAPLPGRSKSGQTKDLLFRDLGLLSNQAVTDIFLFCTVREISTLPNSDFEIAAGNYDITVHHYPIQIGLHPTVEKCIAIHEHMENCLKSNKCIIGVSRNGFGRASTIMATYILKQKWDMTPDNAMDEIREYRGHPAIQTIKQYNFLHEYHAYIDNTFRKDKQKNKNSDGDGYMKVSSKRTLATP